VQRDSLCTHRRSRLQQHELKRLLQSVPGIKLLLLPSLLSPLSLVCRFTSIWVDARATGQELGTQAAPYRSMGPAVAAIPKRTKLTRGIVINVMPVSTNILILCEAAADCMQCRLQLCCDALLLALLKH
jgi:hypothetical protein